MAWKNVKKMLQNCSQQHKANDKTWSGQTTVTIPLHLVDIKFP